ncbi:MAG: hypothetical protein PVS2B2_20120 [Candidatus Acidiferrum sp.]
MRRYAGACPRFYGKSFGSKHAFAQLVAQAVDQAVVRAHALLHDFRRDANHVRVADLAALYDLNYGHARAQFAGLWRHAQDAGVGGFQSVEDFAWCGVHWARAEFFEKETGAFRATVIERGGEASRDGPAGFIGDERDVFARLHGQAGFDGVFCAGHKSCLWWAEAHPF